jgi:glucose-1-phosphate cytidylyltransferase
MTDLWGVAMKAVILAGGLGTRLSEETAIRPKPMVEIGGLPILWHIMKLYSHFGVREFVICVGYRGYMIKEFFVNYRLHLSDITVNVAAGTIDFHRMRADDWRVSLIDTGDDTMTGGRIRRVRDYLGADDFFLTYGDGVSDVDITALLAFHRDQGRLVTMTTVTPTSRFGEVVVDGGRVKAFREKPERDGMGLNGGFFVVSPKAIDYIEGDATIWEHGPLESLAAEGELSAYKHTGFWHSLDTLRDKNHLEQLWSRGEAPWKVW